jgi:hypothetical protein
MSLGVLSEALESEDFPFPPRGRRAFGRSGTALALRDDFVRIMTPLFSVTLSRRTIATSVPGQFGCSPRPGAYLLRPAVVPGDPTCQASKRECSCSSQSHKEDGVRLDLLARPFQSFLRRDFHPSGAARAAS